MVLWHVADENMISLPELQALNVAVPACIARSPSPLKLSEIGKCILRLGRRWRRPDVPKAILVVPLAYSAFATYRGGIFVCTDHDPSDILPPDSPPVMAILLK